MKEKTSYFALKFYRRSLAMPLLTLSHKIKTKFILCFIFAAHLTQVEETQWWILGEASEAVASGSPFLKIPHIVSFCCIFF